MRAFPLYDLMKKLRDRHILDRGKHFARCWKELAPDDVFAGVTRDDLTAGCDEVKRIRERIAAVESWLRGLRLERDQADRKLANQLKRVAAGVRADPDHGEDCGLYRALGFVPKSEIRSGRPRKPRKKDK